MISTCATEGFLQNPEQRHRRHFVKAVVMAHTGSIGTLTPFHARDCLPASLQPARSSISKKGVRRKQYCRLNPWSLCSRGETSHPFHRHSDLWKRTFNVLRKPDSFTCYRQFLAAARNATLANFFQS